MSSNLEILPPRLPLKLLSWFCNPELLEDVEGDLSELFVRRSEKSISKAKLLYLLDVLLLFRPGIIKNFEIKIGLIDTAMIKNYLKITLRNAFRYKGYTLLNLLGLVIGITSSILVLLWVNDEVIVDKFHKNGDRIYQVFRNMRQSSGVIETNWSIPKPAADLMRAEYPEVEEVVQVSWPIDYRIEKGDDHSQEDGFFVTPNFLTLFSFEILDGDVNTALDDLSSIMISRSVAEKYFGDSWKGVALGSSITIDDREVLISGVFENIGASSTLQFDWLLPADYFFGENSWVDDWGNGSFRIYFTTRNLGDHDVVADRLYNEIITHAAGQDNAGEEYLVIHKFQDYYLYSKFDNGVISGGRIDYVRIMTVVAVFILIVACVNFMNLATARSSRRSKEIGLRKVMGARKGSITSQFFFESILMTFISVLIAVLIALIILPFFNQLVEKSIAIDFMKISTWYFLVGLILVVGIISGSYPALLLPTFDIISSIKGSVKQSPINAYFRKGLVVFQFAISTLLIIGTAVIYDQINYVLNKDLGLDKENLVMVRMEGDLRSRLETYKNELKKIPDVISVSASSGNPISYGRSTSSATWEGKDPADGYEINILMTDESFIETMGMEMIAGRAFSDQLSDSTNFIINEVAAELMGFDDPINKDLSFWGINGQIIGVVKNFHMQNLYEPIAPLIISCINPGYTRLALVRVGGNPGKALTEIEDITKELNPVFDFDYEFLDESYASSYQNEVTVSKLANIFTIISIFISCLGLLGLSSYTAEQRSLEIGVRKVHGASISQILILLSKDYSKLLIIAFVLAIPFGYFYTQEWLNNFEFRTGLDLKLFILAGAITFVIGVLTVIMKSYQAASVNPVHSLRDE